MGLGGCTGSGSDGECSSEAGDTLGIGTILSCSIPQGAPRLAS